MIPPFPRDSPHVYEMATDSAPDCAGRFDMTTEASLCRLAKARVRNGMTWTKAMWCAAKDVLGTGYEGRP
jgi:hypothetical protein